VIEQLRSPAILFVGGDYNTALFCSGGIIARYVLSQIQGDAFEWVRSPAANASSLADEGVHRPIEMCKQGFDGRTRLFVSGRCRGRLEE
jgi:hypothetical protein